MPERELRSLLEQLRKVEIADSSAIKSLLLAFEMHNEHMESIFLRAERYVLELIKNISTIESEYGMEEAEHQYIQTLALAFQYIRKTYYGKQKKRPKKDPDAFLITNAKLLIEYLLADFKEQGGGENLQPELLSKNKNYVIINAAWHARITSTDATAKHQEVAALSKRLQIEYTILEDDAHCDVFFFSIESHFDEKETADMTAQIDKCIGTESTFYKEFFCYFITFNDHDTLISCYFSIDVHMFKNASLRLIQSSQFWAYVWRDIWYHNLPNNYKNYKDPLVWYKIDRGERQHTVVSHTALAEYLESVETIESQPEKEISADKYAEFVVEWQENNLSMITNEAIGTINNKIFVPGQRKYSYRTQFMVSGIVNAQCVPRASNLQTNIGDNVPEFKHIKTKTTTYENINGIIEFPIIEYIQDSADARERNHADALERNNRLYEEYDALVSDRLRSLRQESIEAAKAKAEAAKAKAKEEEQARIAAEKETKKAQELADAAMAFLLQEEEQKKEYSKNKSKKKALQKAEKQAQQADLAKAVEVEKKRAAVEAARVAAEAKAKKAAAEAARVAKADATRTAAEVARVAEVEAKRAAAEAARVVEAEAKRAAEAARVVDAEAKRAAAEAKSAEENTARVAAEAGTSGDDVESLAKRLISMVDDECRGEVEIWKQKCQELTKINNTQRYELNLLKQHREEASRTRENLVEASRTYTNGLIDSHSAVIKVLKQKIAFLKEENDDALNALRAELNALRAESTIDFEKPEVLTTTSEITFDPEKQEELFEELLRCSARTLDKVQWKFNFKTLMPLQTIFALPTTQFYRLCKQNEHITLNSKKEIREMFQA